MNKMYRVVWNKTKNMYVVVSELASTVNGKAVKAGVLGAALAVTAFAGPVHATLNEAGTGGDLSVAWGKESKNLDTKSIAIGYQPTTNGENSIAIGTNAQTGVGGPGQSAIAIGANAKAKTNRSVAIGDSSEASSYAVAIGNRVVANPTSVAISGGVASEAARTSVAHSVAIGTYARTTESKTVTEASITNNGTKLKLENFAGKLAEKGYVFSVGATGKERQVQNVAAGKVEATSTDAVNGSQLYAVAGTMSTIAGSVKTILGGNAAVAETGAITMTNIGGTGKDTVEEAIKVAKTEVAAGKNVTVKASEGTNGQSIYTVAVKDDISLNSVTTGVTKVDTNGITIDGKQVITKDGVNANDTKITNVANGDVSKTSKDAVNGSQLHEVKESIESAINEKIKNINGSTTNINEKIDGINQNMNALENRVNSRMDKAVAGSAALAALHPLDFDENDKWNVAAGYGNYRSGSALALGAFYRPNEDTMFSIGGAMGNGQNMVNVGVSLKLGQHNGVSKSRKAMAQEIDDLKAQLQAQDQKIAMLMNAMATMQQGK